MTGVLASVAALLVVGFSASLAWAHARLLSTGPAGDSTVAEPITAVTLTFNEPVKQSSTTITVTTADGSSYSDGAARVVDSTVTQAVRALPAGAVRVTWRTVSADGDPIQGEFGFTVAPSAAPASATPSPTPSATSSARPVNPAIVTRSPDAAAPKSAGSSVPWLPLGIGVAVVILGAVGFLRWRRRSLSR
ncbi:copper resistance protein CopC [Planosporangium flavigriseum]|uniref:CopC domain-containing protein n=1 Tax=Planosporangium flavigriseum TaxID=373681 RepID=A0A8J3PQF1_9ACTN|nr:copper resistance CopC family protein [Planosporangium flavigriseum]NJC68075.1 copper resistance protein CopC [Planosporangium flavigriseum]GIG76863.1 hypothetical protein Pfl04_52670 [Planosporangium flavigriseum]